MYQEATMHASLLHALLESGGPYRLMHVHSICMFTKPVRQTFIAQALLPVTYITFCTCTEVYTIIESMAMCLKSSPSLPFLVLFLRGTGLAGISLQAL